MGKVTLRPDLEGLEPYDPDMRPVEVMLSANENSHGLPQSLRDEVCLALAQVDTSRYPEATSPELRELLGQMWGVPAHGVVLGNGGDEIIFNLLLAFGGADRPLVTCPPTFSAYELYAQLTCTPVVRVPRREGYAVDEDALMQAARGAGIVIVCSPNNPTGNVVDPAFIDRLASSTDALVMVDEAYGEFADEGTSCVGLIARHENVCVLRTLSKAYALAGARVGYMLAGRDVADGLLAVRLPYSVNRFSQAAAAVVVRGREQVDPIVRTIVEERGYLAGQLEVLAAEIRAAGKGDLAVYPSQANFILVRLLPAGQDSLPSAHEVHEELAEGGILVRDFSSAPGLSGGLRFTVGTAREDAMLMDALRRILLGRR